jgi:hypothetical protein
MTTPAWRRLDSPAAPMLATLPLTTGFVVLRWLDAAQHHLGRFVVAGSNYASPARVPKALPVGNGNGYDGQFYYRLALNPFDLARTAFGIRLDSFSRVERMGYPFLAWAFALGHQSLIPLTLVVVNVLMAAVLGLAGGLLAKSAGRHALWGLVFPLYWGYLWTLGRDLTELTAAAFVVLALAALVRDRPMWAAAAFLCAIVSKETSVLLVGTLALSTLWLRSRGRSTGTLALSAPSSPGAHTLAPRRSDLAWCTPLVGFVLWQIVLLAATGKLPIYKSGGENLGLPLVGLAHGLAHYFSAFPSVASALWIGELALMVVLVVTTTRLRSHAPFEFQVLWVVSVVLALCTATGIWLGDVGFRSLDDLFLMSWVVLLFHPNRSATVGALCGGAWLVVAVELIRYV